MWRMCDREWREREREIGREKKIVVGRDIVCVCMCVCVRERERGTVVRRDIVCV